MRRMTAAHVVRLRPLLRHEVVKFRVGAVRVVRGRDVGRLLLVVRRQIREEGAHEVYGVLFVHRDELRDAARRGVRVRAAERFERHFLARHGLDDIRPGDEHLRDAVHHHDEIGHRGRVDGAARARPGDDRDLRDDAGALHIAIEDIAVPFQPLDALLDARARAVVDADHRHARRARLVHHLDDLLREDLAERAAVDGEILREDADGPPVEQAEPGDDAIAERMPLRHREMLGAMDGERDRVREKLPSSSSASTRSRAVRLPRACCFCCASASARSSSACKRASRSMCG